MAFECFKRLKIINSEISNSELCNHRILSCCGEDDGKNVLPAIAQTFNCRHLKENKNMPSGKGKSLVWKSFLNVKIINFFLQFL